MEAAIDHVMHTYGMLVSLDPETEKSTRERLTEHLSGQDETGLAVEGLKFLRGGRPYRRRSK